MRVTRPGETRGHPTGARLRGAVSFGSRPYAREVYAPDKRWRLSAAVRPSQAGIVELVQIKMRRRVREARVFALEGAMGVGGAG